MNLKSLAKTVLYHAGFSIKRIHPVRRDVQAAACGSGATSPADLMPLLHPQNPYAGFDWAKHPFDARGWGGDSPVFRKLIEEVRPELIIEVGTWKGASALTMARALSELGIGGRILCVDTWLGALEFWTDQSDAERHGGLALRHGYPTVYYQFLANVCHKGFQQRIIPFPQTSATAALWLRRHGVRSSLIYVDASHEEEDVFADLCNYWEILSDRGILFGDDYSWDGVRLAVNRFASDAGRNVTLDADKWIIRK